MCGDFEYGERLCEKALAFAREINSRPTLGAVESSFGLILNIKGDWERAVSHLQNAIKYMEESQSLVFLGVVWGWLGWAQLLMGKTKTAVEITQNVKDHVNSPPSGSPQFTPLGEERWLKV
jgi:tetratricopeptide (TPR) repeat protein